MSPNLFFFLVLLFDFHSVPLVIRLQPVGEDKEPWLLNTLLLLVCVCGFAATFFFKVATTFVPYVAICCFFRDSVQRRCWQTWMVHIVLSGWMQLLHFHIVTLSNLPCNVIPTKCAVCQFSVKRKSRISCCPLRAQRNKTTAVDERNICST